MLVRVLLAAIAAGLIGGVFATAAQAVRVTPLIIAAEAYEAAPAATPGHSHDHSSDADAVSGAAASAGHHDNHVHDASEWKPADGIERTLYTLMANMAVGVGFALLLTAAVLLTNQAMDLRAGLAWGVAGFVTFVLAPNLGLPPELPGTTGAALADRQLWWLATVACTGAGLAIFAFLRRLPFMVLGVALIAAPHIWGAPQPEVHQSLAPASLAVDFVVASIATAFAYWLFLGGLLGILLSRALAAEQEKAA